MVIKHLPLISLNTPVKCSCFLLCNKEIKATERSQILKPCGIAHMGARIWVGVWNKLINKKIFSIWMWVFWVCFKTIVMEYIHLLCCNTSFFCGALEDEFFLAPLISKLHSVDCWSKQCYNCKSKGVKVAFLKHLVTWFSCEIEALICSDICFSFNTLQTAARSKTFSHLAGTAS